MRVGLVAQSERFQKDNQSPLALTMYGNDDDDDEHNTHDNHHHDEDEDSCDWRAQVCTRAKMRLKEGWCRFELYCQRLPILQ